MVDIPTEVSGRRLSRGQRLGGRVMEPLISIHLEGQRRDYRPGDVLRGEYQVDAPEAVPLTAIETSVLWYTTGKGDQDMGVHFFERRAAADITSGELRQLWRLETPLPNTPLTYEGVIVKVAWCVRVRVFLDRGKEFSADVPFRLGPVPRARRIESVDGHGTPSPADKVTENNPDTQTPQVAAKPEANSARTRTDAGKNGPP
jgi:hypothetical protein